MKRATSILGAALLTLTLAATIAYATQIVYASPQKLGQVSSLVVRGKVEGVRSFWNETGTKIMTETVLNVDETYKGPSRRSVRIIQLGGVVDNLRMHVHGALSWRLDEEVLLFLEPYDSESYRVTGFSQGKFGIERDPRSGRMFIRQPDVEAADVKGAPAAREAAPVSRSTRISLEQFITDTLGR